MSRRTYDELLSLADEHLQQGHSVVLDASYHNIEERGRVVDYCQDNGVAYYFILCTASTEETRRRLEIRAQDRQAVSDGTWEIYCKQKEVFDYPNELAGATFVEIKTDQPVKDLLTRLTSSRSFPAFSV